MTLPEAYPIEIDVQETQKLLNADASVLLVDCREQNEYDFCQIEQAILIPMNETPARLESFKNFDRVIIYCHLGARSFQVASYLRAQGIENAQSMAGGIEQWSIEIDSDVPRY